MNFIYDSKIILKRKNQKLKNKINVYKMTYVFDMFHTNKQKTILLKR